VIQLPVWLVPTFDSSKPPIWEKKSALASKRVRAVFFAGTEIGSAEHAEVKQLLRSIRRSKAWIPRGRSDVAHVRRFTASAKSRSYSGLRYLTEVHVDVSGVSHLSVPVDRKMTLTLIGASSGE
jgi:hypothetical protein